MPTKVTPAKQRKLDAAKKISELTDWIEKAEEDLAETGKQNLELRVTVPGYNYQSYTIRTSNPNMNITKRVSDYYKRVVREKITAAKKERDSLIKTL